MPEFDVSEDGKRFLMIQAAGPGPASGSPRLDVVLNWFEELRRIAGKLGAMTIDVKWTRQSALDSRQLL